MTKEFVDLNSTIHRELEARFIDFMCLLTELKIDDAAKKLDHLFALLDAHITVENEMILPCLTRLLAPEGSAPDVCASAANTVQLIDGDHTILERTREAMRKQMNAYSDDVTRRDVVVTLDTFLRFSRVLDHHTTREERTLYPILDAETGAALNDADASHLMASLGAALGESSHAS